MQFKTDAAFESSSLQGYIYINHAELCEIFGDENSQGDGYKVDAEWSISFADGTYATIYNWKDGKNYCGEDGLDVPEITEWHIGGQSYQAVERVLEAVADYRNGIVDVPAIEVNSQHALEYYGA